MSKNSDKCWVCMNKGFILYNKNFDSRTYQLCAHCICLDGIEYIYDGSKCERKSDYRTVCIEEVCDIEELAIKNYKHYYSIKNEGAGK